MADQTEISWTDSTFNPWIGCTKVSPGCDHCYAEVLATRYGWARWGKHPRYRTSAANWNNPRAWNADAPRFRLIHGRRRRVFCASLADVFDNRTPKEWRAELFALISTTRELDWQILTKRPQNIAKMLPTDWANGYPNVWLGTTTEDEKHYRVRWPVLSRIPAARRFISYEPAVRQLGNLAITDTLPDWIICGGESGYGARIMNPQWARELRDQCKTLGIPFFHKQWGTDKSNPAVWAGFSQADARAYDPPTNGKGGALLDQQLHRAFPEPHETTGRTTA
jgi:protein gp37